MRVIYSWFLRHLDIRLKMFLQSRRDSSSIRSSAGNPTLIVFIPRHHYVPVHTPVYPPTVLNQPVVSPFQSTITHYQHCMVKLGCTAYGFIIDTVSVKLEAGLTSVNCYRGWSCESYGGLKDRFGTKRDINVTYVKP